MSQCPIVPRVAIRPWRRPHATFVAFHRMSKRPVAHRILDRILPVAKCLSKAACRQPGTRRTFFNSPFGEETHQTAPSLCPIVSKSHLLAVEHAAISENRKARVIAIRRGIVCALKIWNYFFLLKGRQSSKPVLLTRVLIIVSYWHQICIFAIYDRRLSEPSPISF